MKFKATLTDRGIQSLSKGDCRPAAESSNWHGIITGSL